MQNYKNICTYAKKVLILQRFSQKGEDITSFLSLKNTFSMKKMLLIVAVAFAAMACGNKCDKKCCEAEAEAPVEVVAEEAAAEEEAAPVEEAAEAPAEVVAE